MARSAYAVSAGSIALNTPPSTISALAITNGPASTLTAWWSRGEMNWSEAPVDPGGAGVVVVVDGGPVVVVVVVDGAVPVGPVAGSGVICTVASTALTLSTRVARSAYDPMTTYRQNARPPSLKKYWQPAWPGIARCSTVGLKSSAVSTRGSPLRAKSGCVALAGSYSKSTMSTSSTWSWSTAPLAKSPMSGGSAIVDTCTTTPGISPAGAGGPSAPNAATSPNAGRRNTRPSNPAGGLTDTPWAFSGGAHDGGP